MKGRPQTRRDGETSSAKPKVFVSYAREDAEFVDRLVDDLERDGGFDVWLDRRRMRGGAPFLNLLVKEIRRADFFLLVVSRHSNESRWVEKELNKAVTWEINTGRPQVIPLQLSGASLPLSIDDQHCISFGTGSYESGYAKLRADLLEQPPPVVRKSRRPWWVAAAAAVAPTLPLHRSLFERTHEAALGLASRFGGGGGD